MAMTLLSARAERALHGCVQCIICPACWLWQRHLDLQIKAEPIDGHWGSLIRRLFLQIVARPDPLVKFFGGVIWIRNPCGKYVLAKSFV